MTMRFTDREPSCLGVEWQRMPLWRLPFRRFLFVALAATCVSVCLSAGVSAARPQNVVLILADDLGWSDTTLFGTTEFYRTPNIERLAMRGMTFRRAYAASPLCSPTRASILTGLSPARHGITAPQCHTPAIRLRAGLKTKAVPNRKCVQPDSVTRLNPETITLAETLKKVGYATGHFGKWHLGSEPYSPLQHGFDVDVPHWPGPGPAGSYVAPWKFKDFDHDPDVPDEHLEDRMAKEAVAFIRAHKGEPFFLNYWMFSVHAPFDAKKQLIDKYDASVDKQDEQRCPTYAAMIESMDDAVGTLLSELDALGIADNTIIVLASDNGGNMYNLVDGERPTSNRPLRGGKATMYEGGLRTPAVIVWPGKADPGSSSDAIIQSMDFYPTLLEMLELKPADGQTFDGVSLVPALSGESLNREAIFTYFPHQPLVPDWLPPAVSVHSGDWKLIRLFHAGENGAHRYKLFHLGNDVGERADLAELRPQKVRELDALIESHLQATGAVVPIANPAFDAAKYDPSLEGKPAEKFGGPKRSKKRTRQERTAGWRAGGTCRLSLVDGNLRVQSEGKDPYLIRKLTQPVQGGELTLRVRMRSNSRGSGQVFWSPSGKPFRAEHSVAFVPMHDDRMHDYAIRFSCGEPIHAIRLDPSRNSGTIDIVEMQLSRSGEVVRTWRF